jgi:hypothetical protein
MKLNTINLILFVLTKYYSKSNEYDVAHFHARGILTAIASFLLISLNSIMKDYIDFSFFMQSRLMAIILLAPLFLLITAITPSAKTMSAVTIDETEQKRGWYSFWALLAFTVFLFLLSVYIKHGVIIKL